MPVRPGRKLPVLTVPEVCKADPQTRQKTRKPDETSWLFI
nr:MAG TPA_asm: hypothetical protein [Caudoviricetes sp.]